MKNIKESILDSVSRDNGFNDWIHAGIMREPAALTLMIYEAMERYSLHELSIISKPNHFDIHRNEIQKIILGHRGVESRQVHWNECIDALAVYVIKCQTLVKPKP